VLDNGAHLSKNLVETPVKIVQQQLVDSLTACNCDRRFLADGNDNSNCVQNRQAIRK